MIRHEIKSSIGANSDTARVPKSDPQHDQSAETSWSRALMSLAQGQNG